MIRRLAAVLAAFILLFPGLAMAADNPFGVPTVEDYVSDPSRTNFLFQNFSGPTIYPGNSGNLYFRIYNPYNRTMENISLVSEIYAYATLESYKKVDERFPSPPRIEQSKSLRYTATREDLDPASYWDFGLTIGTSESTPEGVYYVRFVLEFDYSNSTNNTVRHFVMRSMSYYSEEQWDYARRNATEGDKPYYRHGLNMTYLSQFYPVDAIIPFHNHDVLVWNKFDYDIILVNEKK